MTRLLTSRRHRALLTVCLLGGALLTIIGVRYLLVPESAARTFGVPGRPAGYELHYVTGLRNVWLGALAIAFATLREWRALALWFAMATIVCFSDATIAAMSTARMAAVAFHVVCGFASIALAVLAWKAATGAKPEG